MDQRDPRYFRGRGERDKSVPINKPLGTDPIPIHWPTACDSLATCSEPTTSDYHPPFVAPFAVCSASTSEVWSGALGLKHSFSLVLAGQVEDD